MIFHHVIKHSTRVLVSTVATCDATHRVLPVYCFDVVNEILRRSRFEIAIGDTDDTLAYALFGVLHHLIASKEVFAVMGTSVKGTAVVKIKYVTN
ncbi:Hypothetical predicted protein [Cloeon dipterum]|uniref:Uncharacterized protein n=1 Tax=Cloeon dipterum TaxID=197152 RepID=A0A8S1DJ24_9INSE|nr:Hypothetical predicted protein [Cloeon dipterum]